MDAIRVGLQLRALRVRRHWRQIDVAGRAGISRGTISNAERGLFGEVSLVTLARVAAVLGADLRVTLRWHGADLDRLLDEDHAALVDLMARRLREHGWDVWVEVTFAIRGERGSIDILALHSASGNLLVVEVKTLVPDFQALVATLDRKARLAREIAAGRGWRAGGVSRLVVIAAGSTSRDRLSRVRDAAIAAFPDRGAMVRSWLRGPAQPISGLLFVRNASRSGVTRPVAGRQRVRLAKRGRNASQLGGSYVSGHPRSSTPA